MGTNLDYQRMGGVYLETPEIHAFINPKRGPLERRSTLMFVDADKFSALWDSRSSSLEANPGFAKPPAFDEWHEALRQTLAWRLLDGPRRPFDIPYVYDFGKGAMAVVPNDVVQMLLDWGVKTFPVMTPPAYVDTIKDAAADDAPVMGGSDYLIDAQETIAGFQQGLPLAKIYRKNPSEDRLAADLNDYATLIHFQLEVSLTKYLLFQRNTSAVTDAQREALTQEVRQLLCRREIVTYCMGKIGTSEAFTGWADDDMETKDAALKFLAGNVERAWKRGNHFHLQVAASSSPHTNAGEPTETAARPKTRPSHLRLLGGNPEDNI